MRNFFEIAFLAVLTGCTLLAVRMYYAGRGMTVSQAEQRVLARFVVGLGIFWLLAVLGYLGGFLRLG